MTNQHIYFITLGIQSHGNNLYKVDNFGRAQLIAMNTDRHDIIGCLSWFAPNDMRKHIKRLIKESTRRSVLIIFTQENDAVDINDIIHQLSPNGPITLQEGETEKLIRATEGTGKALNIDFGPAGACLSVARNNYWAIKELARLRGILETNNAGDGI